MVFQFYWIDEQSGVTLSNGLPHRFSWDLKKLSGESVAPGEYVAIAQVKSSVDGSTKNL